MVYATREITHGSEQVAYSGATGTVTFATGVQKFAPSNDTSQKTIYADATNHMVLNNPATLTIEQANLQYSDEELAQSGHVKVNGGFVDGGAHASFDVCRIMTVQDENGKETPLLEVYYNVSATDYTESDDEDEDEINPKVYTRTLTVKGRSMTTLDGATQNVKQFRIERTDENATIFDTYKTTILEPDAFKSVTLP